MKEYGYKRSMSKKGRAPDNSMCEDFFGMIKNEFSYSKNWKDATCDQFIHELNK